MLSKASNFTRHHVHKTGLFNQTAARCFTAPTQECLDHLKKLGIKNTNIVHNPS